MMSTRALILTGCWLLMDALGTPVCSQESPPATLEQIQAAIDFEKLPKMEGATKARATFTSLTYQAPGTFEQAAEFYRQELSKLGWKEDRSLSSSDHKQLLNLTFDKDGMCLSLSGYRSKPEDNMSITLMNFGNVDVRRFPKLDDAEIQTNQKNAVFYSTAKSADEAVKFCHQFMLNQGWKEKPNPSATVLAKEGRHVMQFQKNAMLATLVVAKGKDNKQTVTYTSSVDTTQRAGSATRQSVNSNATIPANLQDLVTLLDISKLERPAKANNVKATPIALVFESTDSVSDTTAFYRKVLTTAGWKEKASPLETEDVASLHFQKQGYNLQLSAGWDKRKNHAVVGLRHLGNVDVRQLPYPKDCIIETTEVEAINTTTKLSIEEVMQFYREELPKLGWREQKVLGQGVIRFVQNAVTLNIEVKKHTNNQTAIQTRTSIR